MKFDLPLFTRLITGFALWLGLALVTTSCQKEDSDSVAQDRIYVDYSLIYDKAQDKTYARAAFKFGSTTGTQLELKAPSEVRFGNDVMTFVPLVNYYEKTFAGQQTQGTFTFKDLDGKTYVNNIGGLVPAELPASFTNLSKGSAYTVTWDGPPVRANEVLDVTVDGAGQSDPIQVFLQSGVGATEVVLEANRIGLLLNGPAQAVINRSLLLPLQQGSSAGGTLLTRYQGQGKTVPVQ
ncbi:hypothetical protein [Hymenobacter terrenus]|uniref:hypothetical protein n=1 Tax=Hymenobacter terrenus TaxID=1629124 RepID=UPI0006192E8C|nr:hypothetical protein [Hymenobacter terrenus]